MQQLRRRLAKGQQQAFVELYDLLGESLYRYVASRALNSDVARDVVQEVFERLVRYHRQFRRVENVKAYVFQVARNELVRWQEKFPAQKNHAPDASSTRSAISADTGLDQDDWIEHTLSLLDPDDQEIVRLKVLSELTFAEVAEVLILPQGTVASRFRRAMQKLETQLDKKSNTTP